MIEDADRAFMQVLSDLSAVQCQLWALYSEELLYLLSVLAAALCPSSGLAEACPWSPRLDLLRIAYALALR